MVTVSDPTASVVRVWNELRDIASDHIAVRRLGLAPWAAPQQSGISNQESGIRNQESGIRNQESAGIRE
jgi:hypothetical protein